MIGKRNIPLPILRYPSTGSVSSIAQLGGLSHRARRVCNLTVSAQFGECTLHKLVTTQQYLVLGVKHKYQGPAEIAVTFARAVPNKK